MSSSVEYQLENNTQLSEVHSLLSPQHADLIGNHTAVTWSLWGPRGCSMPAESPSPVQVQGCGARHEVKREEDGDVPSPSLPFPALDWTGPSLALRFPVPALPPRPPRCLSASRALSPLRQRSLRLDGTLGRSPPLFLTRRPIASRRAAPCRGALAPLPPGAVAMDTGTPRPRPPPPRGNENTNGLNGVQEIVYCFYQLSETLQKIILFQQ